MLSCVNLLSPPNHPALQWLLFLLFFLFKCEVAAQSPVVVDSQFQHTYITPATFRDASSQISVETIAEPGFLNQFVDGETPFFSFGDDHANWWFSFLVKNNTATSQNLILKLNRKNFDAFKLWQKDSNHLKPYPEVGAKYKITRKYLLMDSYFIEVMIPPLCTTRFIGRVQNRIGSMHLGMSLHNTEQFEYENRQNILVFGIFIGVMLLTILFAIVLYYQEPAVIYLIYLLYVVNILLRETYNYSADFGFFPTFQRYTASFLLAASFGTFFRHFLQLWQLMPNIDRLVVWYVRGVIFVSVLLLFLAETDYYVFTNALLRTTNLANLFFTVLALGIVIYHAKTSVAAFIMLMAYSPLSMGFVLILMRNLNLIGNYPFIQHAVMWGFIFEVLVFTTGFSVWYKKLEFSRNNLRLQLEQEELQHKIELSAAEQRVKDRVARDLHDDVAASVSGIRILSQVAKSQISSKMPNILPLLEQINESAKSAGEGLSDLIWAIKPSPDSLNDLSDRIREYAGKILDAAGVECQFHIPREFPTVNLNVETKRNLFLIVKEAINNALKYSHCTTVDIVLQLKGDYLVLEITDNGIGFDFETTIKGNGLTNMQRRAKDIGAPMSIHSKPEVGTQVSLQLNVPISTN